MGENAICGLPGNEDKELPSLKQARFPTINKKMNFYTTSLRVQRL
jgi:hypothetical protein